MPRVKQSWPTYSDYDDDKYEISGLILSEVKEKP